MRLNIENKKNLLTLSYYDDDLYNHYHARYLEDGSFTLGYTWKEYMEKFAPERDVPFFYCEDLYNYLKGLAVAYSDYIIINYKFNGINLSTKVPRTNEIGFGESYLCGKPLSEMAEGLKTLIDKYALTDRFIVDIIKVELISTKKNNTKRKRTHVPRGLRKEVFKRDNYTCVECGARKEDGATLHIDHKIPVSKGGTDELDNLQTLCSDCNLNKSDVIQ